MRKIEDWPTFVACMVMMPVGWPAFGLFRYYFGWWPWQEAWSGSRHKSNKKE